jgi:drug/metabolite transporter (DMT)-like permease
MVLDEQATGTLLVMAAAMVFALVAFVIQADPLPLLPSTECRFLVNWAVSIVFMLIFRKSRGLYWLGPPELRGLLCLKSFFFVSYLTLWWASLRQVPIGDCIAIIYTAPIFVVILSRMILGEELAKEFPAQVVLNLTGIVLIVDPPFLHADGNASMYETLNKYSYLFTALAFCSIIPIVTRQTKDCSWIEVEHVSAILAAVVLNPALMCSSYVASGKLPDWPAAAPMDVFYIVLASLGGFVGLAMETKGYQLAEAGKASMYRPIEVPFAYVLQHFGTSAPVAPRAVLGALLIVISCGLGPLLQKMKELKADKEDVKKQPLLSVDVVTDPEASAAGVIAAAICVE